MKILALGHRKRTGKDTLAGLIRTQLRMSTKLTVEVAGFADVVKDVSYLMYGWAGLQRKEYYDRHPVDRSIILPLLKETPRDVWIRVGNHTRLSDEHVWANALLRKLDVDVLIVSDLRFQIELDAVRERGGHAIKVTRASEPEENDAADGVLKDYDGWDLVIKNDGTKADLNTWAVHLIEMYNLKEKA